MELGDASGGKSENSWEPFRRETAVWEGEIPYGDARFTSRRYEHRVPNEIASLSIPPISERTAELVADALADLKLRPLTASSFFVQLRLLSRKLAILHPVVKTAIRWIWLLAHSGGWLGGRGVGR